MPPSPSDLETLTLLDRYLDAAPRTGAATEDIGPFTLFISTGIWPYYARPRLGVDHPITPPEVLAIRDRQRTLGVPETFEWVVETTPSMSAAARETGLAVEELPLLVLAGSLRPANEVAAQIRKVGADEFDLARILAVATVAFGNPGTGVSAIGPRERDGKSASDPDRKSTRLNSSHPSISYAVFCLKKKKKIKPGRGRDICTCRCSTQTCQVLRST